MKKRIMGVVCVSMIILSGIVRVAYADPQYTPEFPFASDGFSFNTGRSQQDPETLIVVCDTPPEFESAPPMFISTPKKQAPSVPLSNEQELSEVSAIPEPSTLALLGIGLLSLLCLTRRYRSANRSANRSAK